MINYFAFYYAPLKPRATIGELIRYIGIQFTQAFAPSAMGLRPLTTGWTNTAALVFDSLVFVVIVMVSIYRRPSAWRVWIVFGVGFLANSIMIGANRVGYFGVDFGQQLYYLQAPAYLFLLCVGAAFSLDPSGVPYVMQQEASTRLATAETSPATEPACPHRASVAACLLGVGLYAVAFVTSATTMTAKDRVEPGKAQRRGLTSRTCSGRSTQRAVAASTWPFSTRTCPMASWPRAFLPGISSLYTLPVVSAGCRHRPTPCRDIRGGDRTERSCRCSSRGHQARQVVSPSPLWSDAPVRPRLRRPTPICRRSGLCFTSARPKGTIEVRLVSPLIYARGLAARRIDELVGRVGERVDGEQRSAVPAWDPLIWPQRARPRATSCRCRRGLLIKWRSPQATAGEDVCVSSIDVGTFAASGTAG